MHDASNRMPSTPAVTPAVTPKSTARRKMWTPFSRTSRSRRLSVGKRLQRTPQKTTVQLTGLLRKTWKVFKLTPLYGFHKNDIRKYSRYLSAHLEGESQKADSTDIPAFDKAVISVYKGLKVGADDSEAIQILVKSLSGNGNGAIVLTAILCCVDVEESKVGHDTKEFTSYPIMLIQGTVAMATYMNNWLQAQFDCSISLLHFSSEELTWMVAMWSGAVTDKKPPVELLYHVPSECKGLSTITYTINTEDCQRLWSCIHDSESNDFKCEEVAIFMSALEHHFYYCFKIKLSALRLSRVGTPIAFVGSEGRLKMFSEKHCLQVLRHLTELSGEYLPDR